MRACSERGSRRVASQPHDATTLEARRVFSKSKAARWRSGESICWRRRSMMACSLRRVLGSHRARGDLPGSSSAVLAVFLLAACPPAACLVVACSLAVLPLVASPSASLPPKSFLLAGATLTRAVAITEGRWISVRYVRQSIADGSKQNAALSSSPNSFQRAMRRSVR